MPDREHLENPYPDLNEERLAKLKALFPEAFTEGKLNIDKLRETLGEQVSAEPERYNFTWAGKREALSEIRKPAWGTLVPAKDESVDFDSTKHIFIEGENLEVLKLLYKSYYGRVKMIYIDPPYNTGGDFVYNDKWGDPKEYYLRLTGQKDSDGNLMTTNTEADGRLHSNWLNMMYPRLFLSRFLLKDDGVIFVSIDDNELVDVKSLLDEIYGKDNFIAILMWKSRQIVDSRNKTNVSIDHEYILVYARNKSLFCFKGKEIEKAKYDNPDDDSRGPWMSNSILGLATKAQRPNLHYILTNPDTGIQYECPPDAGWRYSRETMEEKVRDKRIIFPNDPNGRPREKKYLNELESQYTGFSSVLSGKAGYTLNGSREVRDLLGGRYVDFPKPVSLLTILIRQGCPNEGLVLDFFAGSSSTAHALSILNQEDNGNRKFIMAQLPEPTDDASETYKAGYKNIAEIGKERIRRASKKIKEDNAADLTAQGNTQDLGFRVFKLQPSHIRKWQPLSPDTAQKDYLEQLEQMGEPLLDGWNAEEVIYEIMLSEGLSLTSKIESVECTDQELFRVIDEEKEQYIFVCLDERIDYENIKPLGLSVDDRFICRDSALDDTTIANLALMCRVKTISEL